MRHVLRSLAAVSLSLLAFACSAQDGSKFEEGKHYKKVREIQAPTDPKRIEVNEFFWYGCPHCYALEPEIDKWEKAKAADVDFVRYPNSLGRPQSLLHSKAYYTEQALKTFPKTHLPLFRAIHDEHQQLSTPEQIGAIFQSAAGIQPDVFLQTFNSFMVDAQVRKAETQARAYGVTSVPMLIVGGKYMTGPAMASTNAEAIKVLNFLIDKVRKERAGK